MMAWPTWPTRPAQPSLGHHYCIRGFTKLCQSLLTWRPPMDNATCSIIKVPPSLLLGLKMLLLLLPVAAAVKVCTKCSLAKTFFTYLNGTLTRIFFGKNKLKYFGHVVDTCFCFQRNRITKCILIHKRSYNATSRWTLQ